MGYANGAVKSVLLQAAALTQCLTPDDKTMKDVFNTVCDTLDAAEDIHLAAFGDAFNEQAGATLEEEEMLNYAYDEVG